MALIPEVVVTMQELIEWDELQKQMKALKVKEMLLRQRIYKHFFQAPVEGTNKHALNGGYILNAKRVVDRKVDLGTLQALSAEGALFQQKGINANMLIDWEPKLKLKEYRALSDERRAIFEQALIIKDGSPQMEIVLPAAAARAAPAAAAVGGA